MGNALRWHFDEWDEVFEAAVRPDAEQGVLMIILGLMTASLVTCQRMPHMTQPIWFAIPETILG